MPAVKLSRLRGNRVTRDWVSQTTLCAKDIILPYFVVEGENVKEPIKSMPGVYHLSTDNLVKDIAGAKGLRSILLFGVSHKKDETGSESHKKDGIVQGAVKTVKKEFGDLIVITDVCLCGYTSHGHCGIARGHPSTWFDFAHHKSLGTGRSDSFIDNEETLKILAKIALSHAEAGADLVAPSAMMDGQVRAIREILDKNGFKDVGIMAYSAKYASNFYGPFREALNSAPRFGDRKSYQMDFRNSDEALKEMKQDIDEGADIVMVKPALAYLDIIYRAKQNFNVPITAYSVSGEYSMIKNLGNGDKKTEKNLALEALTSIKRAGADFIISYFAKEAIKWLN